MSEKIKEAFQREKHDIVSVNKKVEESEKKKIEIQRELLLIKQKIVVEEELRGELGRFFKEMKTSVGEREPIREEIEEKIKNAEGLINSTKMELKLETQKINDRLDEMEKQIEEGVMMLGEPLKNLLKEVEKKTLVNEKEKLKLLKKEMKRENKKKGIFSKIVEKLSDE